MAREWTRKSIEEMIDAYLINHGGSVVLPTAGGDSGGGTAPGGAGYPVPAIMFPGGYVSPDRELNYNTGLIIMNNTLNVAYRGQYGSRALQYDSIFAPPYFYAAGQKGNPMAQSAFNGWSSRPITQCEIAAHDGITWDELKKSLSKNHFIPYCSMQGYSIEQTIVIFTNAKYNAIAPHIFMANVSGYAHAGEVAINTGYTITRGTPGTVGYYNYNNMALGVVSFYDRYFKLIEYVINTVLQNFGYSLDENNFDRAIIFSYPLLSTTAGTNAGWFFPREWGWIDTSDLNLDVDKWRFLVLQYGYNGNTDITDVHAETFPSNPNGTPQTGNSYTIENVYNTYKTIQQRMIEYINNQNTK